MVIYPNFRYWSVKPWFTAGQKFGSPKPSGFSHEQVLQCLLFGVFNWSQNISDISPTMCIPTQKNRTMYAQILSLSIHIPSYSRYIPSLHDGIWWYMMVYIYIYSLSYISPRNDQTLPPVSVQGRKHRRRSTARGGSRCLVPQPAPKPGMVTEKWPIKNGKIMGKYRKILYKWRFIARKVIYNW